MEDYLKDFYQLDEIYPRLYVGPEECAEDPKLILLEFFFSLLKNNDTFNRSSL